MPSKRDEELEPASSGRMNPAKFVDPSKECAPIGQRIHESKRMIVKAWRARTGRRVRCWPPSPSYRDRQRRATTVSEDDELLPPHRAKVRSRHHCSLAGANWGRLRSQCWMNVRPTPFRPYGGAQPTTDVPSNGQETSHAPNVELAASSMASVIDAADQL